MDAQQTVKAPAAREPRKGKAGAVVPRRAAGPAPADPEAARILAEIEADAAP